MGVDGSVGVDTRIGGPRGPKPGRKKGVLIGKRRAKEMAKAVIVAEVMGRRPADFEGDALDYLQAAYRGEIIPDPLRMQAAAQALKFERPALSAALVRDVTPPATSTSLDERIIELLQKGLANGVKLISE